MDWQIFALIAIALMATIMQAVMLLLIFFRRGSDEKFRFRAFDATIERYLRALAPYDSYPAGTMADMIDSAQRQTGVTLTPGAKQMLAIPVAESPYGTSLDQTRTSIVDIIEAAREESGRLSSRSELRIINSVDLIAGFHRRFCNIPPFCAGDRR
jgi:hypothetical protein